jgi:hypothetical protein
MFKQFIQLQETAKKEQALDNMLHFKRAFILNNNPHEAN